jgi:hypothetical protein
VNANIPEACNYCHHPLLLENLFVDDGCPCNSGMGVNFMPSPCVACGTQDCVKPGHRLAALFGDFVGSTSINGAIPKVTP